MLQTPTTWDDLRLYRGSHGDTWSGQQCAVEVSNLIAAGIVTPPPGLLRCERPLEPVPFGADHPSISRVIRTFVTGLNDAWDDDQRQRLLPYAAKILGTATGPEAEERRAWMATDWLVRVHAPAWLRLAGLEDHAAALERLARIADDTLCRAAQPTISAARKDAAAAAAAAWSAAGAAADAAWAAAAAAAAGEAAWAAARSAPGVAARSEAGAVAADAAWNAAWAAADAAAAAGAAAGAAWAAARDTLAPTVSALQDSALHLLDEMIDLAAIYGGPATDGGV